MQQQIKDFKLESDAFNSRAEKFKLIFNTSPDMIFILSHTGLILDANTAALTVYEYQRKQVFGMSYEKLLSKNTHIKNARKLFESVKNGTEIDYEWLTQTSSGKKIPVDIRLRSLKLNDKDEKSAVVLILRDISSKQKVDEAITALARATNILDVDNFLEESIRSLAQLYETKFIFIGKLLADKKTVQTIKVWSDNQFINNFSYPLENTPCKDALDVASVFIPDNVQEQYPKDKLLTDMQVHSYLAASMVAEEKKLGIVALMHDKQLVIEEWAAPVLELFANRFAVEIERYNITEELKKNKEQLESTVKQRTQTIEEQIRTIKQKNIELEDANQEMKSFFYALSHDLRAPIRGISGFSDVILEDYKDKLDELGKEYLYRIKDSTVSMSALIEGMLQYHSVSHHSNIEHEEVNLSVLAEEILMSLNSMDKSRNVEFILEHELVAKVDRNLMIILFQNLLANAWKYTSKTPSARIEFLQKNINGEKVFVLKDNGAGFDMKYVDLLFEPFKRLHGESEFAGSGIGLASVKKIIDLHEGKIWAESPASSSIKSGAAFYFTL